MPLQSEHPIFTLTIRFRPQERQQKRNVHIKRLNRIKYWSVTSAGIFRLCNITIYELTSMRSDFQINEPIK